MAPNNFTSAEVLQEDNDQLAELKSTKNEKTQYRWILILFHVYLHMVAVYALYVMFTSAKIWTVVSVLIFAILGMLGVTAGGHRLWSHRSYKATWQLRLILVTLQTLAFQDPAIDWARDHRVHHKHSETDADPYNSKRGFFFSHMGWLYVNKHPEVIAKGKGIDHSDLFQDRFLVFQKKYYFYVMPIMCFLIPIFLPMYLWEESFSNAYAINTLRYLITLHSTMAINSVAHRWGNKPYEKNISPAEIFLQHC
ncbi:hypothetical protein FQR65_LT09131 [Abscondita terminalis]|nr:hypothetical protein FQR65_LT09131 [Abscondita terminalis]